MAAGGKEGAPGPGRSRVEPRRPAGPSVLGTPPPLGPLLNQEQAQAQIERAAAHPSSKIEVVVVRRRCNLQPSQPGRPPPPFRSRTRCCRRRFRPPPMSRSTTASSTISRVACLLGLALAGASVVRAGSCEVPLAGSTLDLGDLLGRTRQVSHSVLSPPSLSEISYAFGPCGPGGGIGHDGTLPDFEQVGPLSRLRKGQDVTEPASLACHRSARRRRSSARQRSTRVPTIAPRRPGSSRLRPSPRHLREPLPSSYLEPTASTVRRQPLSVRRSFLLTVLAALLHALCPQPTSRSRCSARSTSTGSSS